MVGKAAQDRDWKLSVNAALALFAKEESRSGGLMSCLG
jgi:hypothetical protein